MALHEIAEEKVSFTEKSHLMQRVGETHSTCNSLPWFDVEENQINQQKLKSGSRRTVIR